VEPPDLPTRIDEPITLNGVYAYLRVLQIGGRLAPIADQRLADLRDGHYAGGILDLRGAAGQRVVPLGETFAFLGKDPIPIVCLLDAKTAPAPAQFAASLRDTYQVVLVGQPSAASLPPSEDVLLATGERIRLPIVDAPEVAGPAPVQPDIAVASGPVAPVTSATAADWSTLASRDPALRRAVDLLTSIRALRQR
jgi:hypothetical protein